MQHHIQLGFPGPYLSGGIISDEAGTVFSVRYYIYFEFCPQSLDIVRGVAF
jgi:hypothetical protein